ncbi:MAG: A/G-specific adenine glycosylase [Candidatus Promineifilaceae bacterium]
MSELPDIAPDLLTWWDGGHSLWPWRENRDPYAIWVAEVMLQQTQIVTVLPYYRRWMDRFPSVQTLADASLDDVLKLWEGLGYYSRARNLHYAAEMATSRYNGHLPRTVDELMELKGIGRYTAGAISSIAYGQAVPAVDGNGIRILSRIFDIADDISKSATKRKMWSLAEDLLSLDRPGDFNQALMELGQTLCLPTSPNCQICPLASFCLAKQRGTQLERPVRPRRKEIPHYQVAAAIICRDDGRFLIAKRPANGLLGGLWEFPGGKQEEGERLQETLRREISEELGIDIEVNRRLVVVKHAYSHFRITLHAFLARHREGRPQNLAVADHTWVKLGDLEEYAFASADRKIIKHLQAGAASNVGKPCSGIRQQVA